MMQGIGDIMGGQFGFGMGSGALFVLIVLALAGVGFVSIIRWIRRR